MKIGVYYIFLSLLTTFLIQCPYSLSGTASTLSLYDILGIDSKADENAVKKAYRKLAMKVNVAIKYITDSST